MTKLEEIKAALDQARKDNKAEKAVLSLLYSNCLLIGKQQKDSEINDERVTITVKRLIKGIEETKSMAVGREDVIAKCNRELAMLQQFLPQQLTQEELEREVKNLVNSLENPTMKDMGKIMGKLKEKYAGRYDGAEASKLVKAALGAVK